MLRFVAPRHYDILSPPVEKLLEMGSAHKPREKYRKYVKALRTLRDERGFACDEVWRARRAPIADFPVFHEDS